MSASESATAGGWVAWNGDDPAPARLWASSLALVMGLHVACALGVALIRSEPVNDMPAGAFSLELAAFGGNPTATPGGAVKVPPPPAPKVEPKPAPAAPSAEAPSKGGSAAQTAAPTQTAGGGGGVVSGRLGGGGVGLGTPLGRYKVLVFQALWANRRYPPIAQRRGYQGDVEIEFTIAADGEVLGHKVLSGSGFSVLDREADALLRRVRRFPSFLHDLKLSTLTFRVIIPFQLT